MALTYNDYTGLANARLAAQTLGLPYKLVLVSDVTDIYGATVFAPAVVCEVNSKHVVTRDRDDSIILIPWENRPKVRLDLAVD